MFGSEGLPAVDCGLRKRNRRSADQEQRAKRKPVVVGLRTGARPLRADDEALEREAAGTNTGAQSAEQSGREDRNLVCSIVVHGSATAPNARQGR